MSWELAEAVWVRYKAGDNNLRDIQSLAEQVAYVRNLDIERRVVCLKKTEDKRQNRYLEGMVTADKVALSNLRDKMRELQRV